MRNLTMSVLYAIILLILAVGTAKAQTATEEIQDCEECPIMIEIPRGQGMIGVEPYEANTKRGDLPLRNVSIDYRLAIGKLEVTRAQYRAFMEDSGHEMLENGCNTWGINRILGYVKAHDWDGPGFPQNEAHPVVCVSHADATVYAEWLSQKTGNSYRLPSSTEWEYAARAGTRGPWFWGFAGADACEYANVGDDNFRRNFDYAPVFDCDDGYVHTAPSGSFTANAWGLHDMLGNAWEWTDDCLHRDNKDDVPVDGSAWLDANGGECDFRTPRGGGWVSGTDYVRAAAQAGDGATYHSQLLGFRIALEL